MRLLVVNSNTSDSVTARIATTARDAARPGTEVAAVSAPFGLPLIVSRADWLVAGPATLAALAAAKGSYDAAVVACFGDPGVEAAKELFDVPVVGISEAAFHAAAMLGRRFGVVSFTAALRPMFEECLARNGLASRCSGFRMGPAFAGDPGRVAEERREMIVALCRAAVEEDGAEVVILGGGPLAGLAPAIAPSVAVPLVDGTVAAVRMAEALVGLAPPGQPRPRRARGLTGFEPGLTALFAG
ncbi:Asp/Glu/hydantoin racemase [Humitalea rosea]|uniref:Asp/Glu/hydantoin racemase n=1 Tax=Humitalea rosea TaxID=990373 RepID=A0A2W7I9A6_9PROT|nr:aspartate/glutamate racemase family protein [Humitalea rosea]PZW42112.1 Asp/Glu/hydantoin racemase [Humitalea rosea]